MLLGVGKFGPKWVGKFERNIHLNTFGGKTSILTLSFEPQNGQQNHTVCDSVTTNPVCGA